MKKEILSIAGAALAAVVFSGCETMYSGNGFNQRKAQRDQAVIQQEMERRQVQQDAQSARLAAQSAESRLDQIDMRVDRLEDASRATSWATISDVEALRRENQELRAALADARAEHERLRSEIIGNVQGLLKEQQKRNTPPPAPQPKPQTGYEHKVESGQTLSAIAQAYGVSVQKIKDANGLKNDVIRVGQTLFIPD